MKTFTASFNYFLYLLIIVAFIVSGCGTTSGLERSEAMQTSMDRVDQDVEAITSKVNSINSALNELTRQGQGDIRGAYERFSEQVNELRDLERQFEDNTNRMESNAETYFEGWARSDDQYENREIQRKSEERRSEISQRYDRINQSSSVVKENLRSYVSNINEIESFLSNDLTSQGINSISDIAENAVDEGEQLKNELNSLQSAIASTRDEIRRGGITMN